MGETKFNVVKPNLYTIGNSIYFSIQGCDDVLRASELANEVISEYIGPLNVKEAYLDIIRTGKSSSREESHSHTIPLEKYLDALRSRGGLANVTYAHAELFGITETLEASTYRNLDEISNWAKARYNLKNLEDLFESFESSYQVLVLDRGKTMEKIRGLYEELDPKIPDNLAILSIVGGDYPIGNNYLGYLNLRRLKGESKDTVEKTRNSLVEKLKGIEGPPLSFDAPSIFKQMCFVYENASELVERAGDVLLNPRWKEKLFRFDPQYF